MTSEKKKQLFIKILGVILGIIYLFLLLVHDAFDSNEFEVMKETIPNSTVRILITILRAFTSASILIAILSCFYNFRFLSRAIRYFSPTITILNIVFCKINFTCYLGNTYTTELLVLRIVFFVIENLLILGISFLKWYEFIKEKDQTKVSIKNVVMTIIFVLCVTIIGLPITTFLSLNGGEVGFNTRGFGPGHIIMIILAVFFLISITIFFKKRSTEEKWFVCSFLALALIFSYFSRYDFQTYKELFTQIKEHQLVVEMYVLPLHLCNFGIILCFISYTFRMKSTYYFNFLANLFGYLLAMILPNISGDIFTPTTIHYWQNHIYGIALSILGLSLSLFPKPTKKDLLRSMVCFSVYFIIVALIDIRFSYDLENNRGCNIFFLNSSMYSDILHIGFLRENPFVWRINDSFGIEHRIYFLYWPIVYLVYTLLITGLYYVTQLIYKIIGFSKPKLSN